MTIRITAYKPGPALDDFMHSSRQGRLASIPKTAVDSILAEYGEFRYVSGSKDGKCKHTWEFLADGTECAIWDYNGSRWSLFGPRAVFEEIFGPNNVQMDPYYGD